MLYLYWDKGYTVNYSPPLGWVPEGISKGGRAIFDRRSWVEYGKSWFSVYSRGQIRNVLCTRKYTWLGGQYLSEKRPTKISKRMTKNENEGQGNFERIQTETDIADCFASNIKNVKWVIYRPNISMLKFQGLCRQSLNNGAPTLETRRVRPHW